MSLHCDCSAERRISRPIKLHIFRMLSWVIFASERILANLRFRQSAVSFPLLRAAEQYLPFVHVSDHRGRQINFLRAAHKSTAQYVHTCVVSCSLIRSRSSALGLPLPLLKVFLSLGHATAALHHHRRTKFTSGSPVGCRLDQRHSYGGLRE